MNWWKHTVTELLFSVLDNDRTKSTDSPISRIAVSLCILEEAMLINVRVLNCSLWLLFTFRTVCLSEFTKWHAWRTVHFRLLHPTPHWVPLRPFGARTQTLMGYPNLHRINTHVFFRFGFRKYGRIMRITIMREQLCATSVLFVICWNFLLIPSWKYRMTFEEE